MALIFQSAVLVWDPSVYNASIEEWYNKPDWPFFEQFFSKRLMKPEDSLYLLHPGFKESYIDASFHLKPMNVGSSSLSLCTQLNVWKFVNGNFSKKVHFNFWSSGNTFAKMK